MIMIFKISLTS